MFCPECGEKIYDQSRFCPKCGATIPGAAGSADEGPVPAGWIETPMAQPEVSTATAVKPPKKRKGKVLIVVALVAAVLIAVALYLLLRPSGSPESDAAIQSETETPDPDESETETPDPDESETETPDPDESETDAPDPVQDANAELLELIDQAEAAHEEMVNELSSLDWDEDESDATFVETNRQRVQILNGFLADLDELREKADDVSGLDSKMKNAKDEYFNMLRDARSVHAESLTFLADYFELFETVLVYRPLEDDYEDLTEYSQALSTWCQEAKEGYADLSCPTCVESEWKQYGELLDYNESIAQKLDLAIQYNDELRLHSTRNMTARYDTMEASIYEKMLGCIKSEHDHAGVQQGKSTRLAEEMHAYAEMSQEEKDAYEFEAILTGKILLDYDAVDTIFPSLYNTYDAFVIVKTGCISGERNIVIEAEIPGFTQKYTESFRLDSSYRAIYIKPPALTGELDLSATKDAQISVKIFEQDGTLIQAKTFPVTLKSKYDFDWYSDEYGVSTRDNILCFLTPESSAVSTLKRKAIDEITDMTGNRIESFVGYQNVYPDWNQYMITYLQTAGLMRALYEDLGVRYNMDPFSISGSNQHILFPEDVVAQQSGLCIETSLVIASALQSANMHAFLLFPPGHAQVAVEVWNSGECKGEYFLIETTALSSTLNNREHFIENANQLLQMKGSTGIITYYNAAQWKDYLENNVDYLIDCDDSQLLGLTPFAN